MKKTNLFVDFEKNLLVMNQAFATKARNVRSEEYKILQETRRDYPTYAVVKRRIKRNSQKETYAGLTYAKHKFVNDCDADCDTCGYTRTVSHATDAKWSADETGHWYACKNCGEKTSFAYHQQENGTCLICKQSMIDAQIPALGDTTETPAVVPNSNTTSAPSVSESSVTALNTTEIVSSQEESAGLSWMALVIIPNCHCPTL